MTDSARKSALRVVPLPGLPGRAPLLTGPLTASPVTLMTSARSIRAKPPAIRILNAFASQ